MYPEFGAYEIGRRLASVSHGWFVFRAFWFSKVPARVKVLVFRSMVIEPSLSCMCSFVLNHTQTQLIDKKVLKYARVLYNAMTKGINHRPAVGESANAAQ